MSNKLLVVVDMQNDFIDGVLGSKQAKDIVAKVADKIENWDGRIFVTMDNHMENIEFYHNTVEGRRIPQHCVSGSDGWRLNPMIKDAIDAVGPVYICQKFDRFATHELGAYVNRNGIEYVEFVGLCTDICVISNALMLRTTCPSVDIVVDASCCAGISEESHNAALTVMRECCIDIIHD